MRDECRQRRRGRMKWRNRGRLDLMRGLHCILAFGRYEKYGVGLGILNDESSRTVDYDEEHTTSRDCSFIHACNRTPSKYIGRM